MNKNVLITGGAGFIGINLAAKLLKIGYRVTIFDNFSRTGSTQNNKWLIENSNSRLLTVLKKDIRDWNAISKAVGQADIVFHLAGQVAVTTSVKNPKEDFEINALGSLNVFEAARKKLKMPIVLFASTNKVYGALTGLKIKSKGVDESCPLDFYSPYGCSKGVADQYARDYFRIYGLPTVVFRQSCIYGPRQMGVEDQGWVAHFAIATIFDRPIVLYGDGLQIRDILYVDDLIDAYLLAMEKIGNTAGKIYNIGGGNSNSLSLLKYLDLLERILKKKIQITHSTQRPGDQKLFIADTSLAMKDLGWKPKVGYEQGIRKLLSWISDNKDTMASLYH